MNKKISITTILIVLFAGVELALAGARIIKISGEVKVRRGVEENWQPAQVGMLLEDIDTILTGFNSMVILQLSDGSHFELGNNSILDISDLRKISEQELFLYLMSQKIQRIEPREGKTRLRIGNVSVVHGESKAEAENPSVGKGKSALLVQEKNGALALYDQKFYPNSIIKFYKLIDKYNQIKDCGEIYLYLGRSFEAVNHVGQAIDAYQMVVNQQEEQNCNDNNSQKWLNEARQAIDRLKSNN